MHIYNFRKEAESCFGIIFDYISLYIPGIPGLLFERFDKINERVDIIRDRQEYTEITRSKFKRL